jgi:nucleoside-diphosphate-sugar epimerase
MDSGLYAGCGVGAQTETNDFTALHMDIRDATPAHFEGVDAVLHLAAISNDPLGDQAPETTVDINHRGAVHVARMAKQAGVPRFVQSSTCSIYGAHGNEVLDESAEFRPVTPYGEAKVAAEADIAALADDDFSPTFLRNATAYGVSSRLRGDLVVNNLTGYAFTTGEVLMKSDGTPWRPLVHIEDIARAFLAVIEAPRELVHNEPFNVGGNEENYRVRDVAAHVETVVKGSTIAFAGGAGPDKRNYKVDCSKIVDRLGWRATWTVRRGVEELYKAFQQIELTVERLIGPDMIRLRRIRDLQDAGRLGTDLRWLDG